jgi:hypothetical protein
MDLAQGHVLALAALDRDSTFAKPEGAATGFGGSGGKYKAYNLGKGKGMSVMNMMAAMEKASGFTYKYEIVGRRYVPSLSLSIVVGFVLMEVLVIVWETFLTLLLTLRSRRRSSGSKLNARSRRCAVTSGTGSRASTSLSSRSRNPKLTEGRDVGTTLMATLPPPRSDYTITKHDVDVVSPHSLQLFRLNTQIPGRENERWVGCKRPRCFSDDTRWCCMGALTTCPCPLLPLTN